jgi:uncharacterized protein (TIGR02452 family)
MNYWEDKEARAKRAKEHTAMMSSYPVSKGKVYGNFGDDRCTTFIEMTDPNIPMLLTENIILNCDVAKAIKVAYELPDENRYDNREDRHIWVLNFASYKNPGGKFIDGSLAQEESICHISNLYNHLVLENEYYEINKTKLNNSLYMNRAIIHRGVSVHTTIDDNPLDCKINVITCAAPNAKAAMRYHNVPKKTCDDVLNYRACFVNYVLFNQPDIDVLILGAWGCGVFGNDANEVARLWRTLFFALPDHRGTNRRVTIIHPLPDKKTYDIFKNVYDGKEDKLK